MDILTLIEQDVTLRRVSTTNGGEHAGPCPSCKGSDRFRVWPEQGRYWCRQCNKSGDVIQYLRDFRGMSFQQASKAVGKSLGPYRPTPAHDTLWLYLEEQFLLCHEEMTLIAWAESAIRKNPALYSEAERMEWAVSAVKLIDWYTHLTTLWEKVEHGTRADRARA